MTKYSWRHYVSCPPNKLLGEMCPPCPPPGFGTYELYINMCIWITVKFVNEYRRVHAYLQALSNYQ